MDLHENICRIKVLYCSIIYKMFERELWTRLLLGGGGRLFEVVSRWAINLGKIIIIIIDI